MLSDLCMKTVIIISVGNLCAINAVFNAVPYLDSNGVPCTTGLFILDMYVDGRPLIIGRGQQGVSKITQGSS